MIQKLSVTASIIFCLLCIPVTAQQHYPPANGGGCACDSCGGGYDDYSHGGGEWIDDGPYFDGGCDSCVGGRRTPVRNLAGNAVGRVRGRAASRFGGRFGGQDILRGRPGNMIGAPYVTGECGDCNWGPFYLSIFAGVSFIDNLDSRFTFDNGMPNMLGVQETGFETLDGSAAGASIGRYFYRQARVEFESTFRENGVGDMGVFTFSDDLTTPQINDTLVSNVTMPADGNVESNSFMLNFLFDLKPRTVGCMNAYLGGGIGVLYVDSDIMTPTASFDINDTSFAFQGIAGINFPVRERVDLFTEYRYLGADSVSVDRTDMAGTVSLGAFRFDSHNVVFGLRFLR